MAKQCVDAKSSIRKYGRQRTRDSKILGGTESSLLFRNPIACLSATTRPSCISSVSDVGNAFQWASVQLPGKKRGVQCSYAILQGTRIQEAKHGLGSSLALCQGCNKAFVGATLGLVLLLFTAFPNAAKGVVCLCAQSDGFTMASRLWRRHSKHLESPMLLPFCSCLHLQYM
jgi:hypothetical protein